jgi:hypothetical protein
MQLNPSIWVELGRRDVEHLGVALSQQFYIEIDPRTIHLGVNHCQGPAVDVFRLQIIDI